MGQQRRVGGDDHDDRTGARRRAARRWRRQRDASGPSSRPTATPLIISRSRRPWLAWTSTPTVKPPASGATTREAVPMPPLKPWQIMPVPPPTPTLDHDPARLARRGVAHRRGDVLGAHMEAVGVVEHPVPGLADDRQRPERTALLAARGDLVRDQRVTHDTDRMRVGECDRRGQQTRLAHPLQTRQLAVAVEAVWRREQRPAPDVRSGLHDRDAGADRSRPHPQRPLAADQRAVADADPPRRR